MRDAELGRHSGGDPDRPVDPGGNHAVDAFGGREPLDPPLVLGGDDRPPVGEGETERGGIAVDRDREEPALPRRLQQTKLGRTRA